MIQLLFCQLQKNVQSMNSQWSLLLDIFSGYKLWRRISDSFKKSRYRSDSDHLQPENLKSEEIITVQDTATPPEEKFQQKNDSPTEILLISPDFLASSKSERIML